MRSRFQTGAAVVIATLLLSACGGGGAGGGVSPTPAPTATPQADVTCPSTGSLPSSLAQSAGSVRRMPERARVAAAYVPGTIAVTYDRTSTRDRIASSAQSLRGKTVSDLDFHSVRTQIVHVDPSRVDDAIAQFKSLPGVKSVARVGYRSRMTIVSNDPYYAGFGAPQPYYETASTFGQWDMHAINVESAWNTVKSTPPVVGTAAPIAIVDTGVDVTHPELSGGTIIRTRCFVTFPDSSSQTTGQYITDTDGHGTNVAGIAAGDTDNGFGFASASYDAKIMAYRIFPSDPAGGCEVSPVPDQCNSDTADEATAINDAVTNGAKVINLSLGGDQPCNTSDPEYQAVENAIAHGVVVVAAAGNGDPNTGLGLSHLDCPANDPGVIAVGASAIDDNSVPGVQSLKVASYSNYLTSHGTSSNGAYLVAPGGDPSGGTDPDDLHWIEHIYSSTAAQAGNCGPDFNSTSSVPDCKIQIAGTSQATPHVAGAAALIKAARPDYTPAQVAAALCNSAVDIGDPTKQGCGQLDAAAAVQYAISH